MNVGKPNDDITLYDGEQQCDKGCDRLLKHTYYTDLAAPYYKTMALSFPTMLLYVGCIFLTVHHVVNPGP
jgi:hypothetical protein